MASWPIPRRSEIALNSGLVSRRVCLGRGANRRERSLGGRGSRCSEGGRGRRAAAGAGGTPGRLPAAGPLSEREGVAALERRIDDLGHAVVIAITVTHASKVRR